MLGWLKKDDVIPEIITSGEEGRWRAISKRLAALSRLPSTEIDLKHFSGKAQCGCFSYNKSNEPDATSGQSAFSANRAP